MHTIKSNHEETVSKCNFVEWFKTKPISPTLPLHGAKPVWDHLPSGQGGTSPVENRE